MEKAKKDEAGLFIEGVTNCLEALRFSLPLNDFNFSTNVL